MDDKDVQVVELVAAASAGDEDAWSALVDRYSPLLAAVIGRYRLSQASRQDVAQIVWLRLIENLSRLRSAHALPKWLVTTARREAVRQLTAQARTQVCDPLAPQWTEPSLHTLTAESDPSPEAGLLVRERHEALLTALAELPDGQRRLVLLLITEPPLTYAQIAQRLGIPIGYIGPTRGRALDRLRRSEAMQALLDRDIDLREGCGS